MVASSSSTQLAQTLAASWRLSPTRAPFLVSFFHTLSNGFCQSSRQFAAQSTPKIAQKLPKSPPKRLAFLPARSIQSNCYSSPSLSLSLSISSSKLNASSPIILSLSKTELKVGPKRRRHLLFLVCSAKHVSFSLSLFLSRAARLCGLINLVGQSHLIGQVASEAGGLRECLISFVSRPTLQS